MCVNSSATDGLPAIALASSPPSGKAWSRLSRMVLFRSQESSRASSRLWSCVDIIPSVRCHNKRDRVYDTVTYKSEQAGGSGETFWPGATHSAFFAEYGGFVLRPWRLKTFRQSHLCHERNCV